MEKCFIFNKGLRLPAKLRKKLGGKYGKLVQAEHISRLLKKSDTVFAIGDVTCNEMLSAGVLPKIAIFDLKTGRKRVRYRRIKCSYPDPVIVKNIPGTISREIWNAVKKAAKGNRPVGIRVYGEEDLASLACIHFAPINAVVAYGIRGKGMNFIRVNDKIKKTVNGILLQMEQF